MTGGILLEVCVGSAEAAMAAQEGGADRVELCANLLEGGTTPSAGTIQFTHERLDIGLQVIIRPRGGDFCYTDAEFEIMKIDSGTGKFTLDGNGSETINGQASIDVEKQLCGLAIKSNGTNWYVIDTIGDCNLRDISGTLEIVYTKFFSGVMASSATTDSSWNRQTMRPLPSSSIPSLRR